MYTRIYRGLCNERFASFARLLFQEASTLIFIFRLSLNFFLFLTFCFCYHVSFPRSFRIKFSERGSNLFFILAMSSWDYLTIHGYPFSHARRHRTHKSVFFSYFQLLRYIFTKLPDQFVGSSCKFILIRVKKVLDPTKEQTNLDPSRFGRRQETTHFKMLKMNWVELCENIGNGIDLIPTIQNCGFGVHTRSDKGSDLGPKSTWFKSD